MCRQQTEDCKPVGYIYIYNSSIWVVCMCVYIIGSSNVAYAFDKVFEKSYGKVNTMTASKMPHVLALLMA